MLCDVLLVYVCVCCVFFFFKQKTAYELRISDWSSDVCSSDLGRFAVEGGAIDPVTGTDGLSAWSGPIGPFPEGALAMHDTDDGAGQQNFKLVDWRQVRRALGLE